MPTDNPRPSDIKCSRAYWTHGVAGPYTLKAEQRLDALIGFDRRLSHAARMVFRFLLSWDMESHGNALASARFISSALKAQDPAGAGLPRSTVNDAINLLCETGWITQISRGTGPKNASRYEPAWHALALAERGEFPSIVANRPVLTDASEPSDFPGRYRPISPDASAENRPIFPDKDSHTDALKEARTVGNEVSAPAPAAIAPGGAGGFERVWLAYDKYGNKQASRKAFDAIPEPDVDHIAKRAASWAASAKPGQRRMPLERWLTAEKYDEADRSVTPKPAKPAKPAPPTERPEVETITFTDAIIVQAGDRKVLRLVADGFEHDIVCEAADEDEQTAGQLELVRLADISDLGEIEDPAALIGKSVSVTWFGNRPVLSRAAGSAEPEGGSPVAVAASPAGDVPIPAAPRPSAPKRKIEQRPMPRDRKGKLAMLERWRRNGFFEDDDAA